MDYNFAAKNVDDNILEKLAALADEQQLVDKYESLLNGDIINTGEKRHVLHQLTRGQLKGDVIADGVNKRAFYVRSIRSSRIALRHSQRRFTPVRSATRRAKSSQRLSRSESADRIWDRERFTSRWKTGQGLIRH